MKKEIRDSFEVMTKLTLRSLKDLKDRGYRYVQVMGFTHDRRLDYMEPKYFLLLPIKLLPEDQYKKEIYEPIESLILMDWARTVDEGFEVYIVRDKKQNGL